ncbi:hypothetical protein WS83_01765 [Burkholderia sp. MSMB2042]|nr:hypothetical protein WS83_01765 [Burkholderia sp. MSMB2042]
MVRIDRRLAGELLLLGFESLDFLPCLELLCNELPIFSGQNRRPGLVARESVHGLHDFGGSVEFGTCRLQLARILKFPAGGPLQRVQLQSQLPSPIACMLHFDTASLDATLQVPESVELLLLTIERRELLAAFFDGS